MCHWEHSYMYKYGKILPETNQKCYYSHFILLLSLFKNVKILYLQSSYFTCRHHYVLIVIFEKSQHLFCLTCRLCMCLQDSSRCIHCVGFFSVPLLLFKLILFTLEKIMISRNIPVLWWWLENYISPFVQFWLAVVSKLKLFDAWAFEVFFKFLSLS